MRLDVVACFMVITIAYAENFVNMEMKNLVFAKKVSIVLKSTICYNKLHEPKNGSRESG